MIVEEVSQLADDYLCPMLNFIAYSAFPHDINWSKTVFCVEPYQLPPSNGIQCPDPYYYDKWLSFL